jgi:hypothetical protein
VQELFDAFSRSAVLNPDPESDGSRIYIANFGFNPPMYLITTTFWQMVVMMGLFTTTMKWQKDHRRLLACVGQHVDSLLFVLTGTSSSTP